MKLYHGTSETAAKTSINFGLKPRSSSSVKTNWPGMQSHADMVYLTTAYAPFFALQAVKNQTDRAAIIEIDTSYLNQNSLYPDEDFLEQISRGHKVPGCKAKTLKGRTRWFRENLASYQHLWKDSIENIGNVAYLGTVPISAITGVSFFDYRSNLYVASLASDPSISVLNYKFCKDKYVELIKWFFKSDYDMSKICFGYGGGNLVIGNEMFEKISQTAADQLRNTSGLEVRKFK